MPVISINNSKYLLSVTSWNPNYALEEFDGQLLQGPCIQITPNDLAASDNFGFTSNISEDGNTIVVGAYLSDLQGSNSGSVYVFVRDSGNWILQTKLIGSGVLTNSNFGYAVSVSSNGNTILVSTTGQAGIYAYIFVRNGITWSQQSLLSPSVPTEARFFGYKSDISGDGNTAIIGAPEGTYNGIMSGSAYIFVRNGVTWTQQGLLIASDAAATDYFGYDVKVNGDGNTAIIGAIYEDATGSESGSAYIFVRNGTTWTQQTKLPISASYYAATDYSGNRVSIDSSGDVAVVGALGNNYNNGGAVHTFTRSGTVWTAGTYISADDSTAANMFSEGLELSSDGTTLLVGAYYDPVHSTSGSVYVYTREGNTWTKVQKLFAPQLGGSTAGYQFGRSVSISTITNTTIIGAPNAGGKGALFVKDIIPYKSRVVFPVLESPFVSKAFGQGVSINAAGNTAVVGAPYTKTSSVLAAKEIGSTNIYIRVGTSWVQQTTLFPTPITNYDSRFGWSVAIDAIGTTVLVSMPYGKDASYVQTGSVFVFTRSQDGNTWSKQALLLSSDGALDSRFGLSLSLSADGNTALIGNVFGSAYIFVRDGSSWTQQAKLYQASLAPSYSAMYTYLSLSADGNLAVVGDYLKSSVVANGGAVYTFTRVGTTWTQQAEITPNVRSASEYFGASVSLSGSGTTLVVSSSNETFAYPKSGAYIFTYANGVWTQTAKLIGTGSYTSDGFGSKVVISADGNRIVIGAQRDTEAGDSSGAVYVFAKIGLHWIQQQKILATTYGQGFGDSLALDATGLNILVGSPVPGHMGGSTPYVQSGSVSFIQPTGVVVDSYTNTMYDYTYLQESSSSVAVSTAFLTDGVVTTNTHYDGGSIQISSTNASLGTSALLEAVPSTNVWYDNFLGSVNTSSVVSTNNSTLQAI